MTPQERLVATAMAELGYLGHRSNAQLDMPTANGGGKYNKFARDLDALGNFYNGPKQGFDWCDIFVDWCFVQTFGRELAQKLTFQPNRSCGAGTAYSLGYYKQHGRLFSVPLVGDQIFFGNATSTWHTGIVTQVTANGICTVEGNAGSPSGVHKFQYRLGSNIIKGYGRPDWSLAGADPGPAPAAPAAPRPGALKVGDIVEFTGSRHYANSTTPNGSRCKPGRARVTGLAIGTAHPYHLVRESGGCTVYGWVDAADIKR